MSVQPLCHEPHPLLRRHARPIERFSKEIRWLAADLLETMYAHEGVGLAAPQIGCDVRLFVANPSRRRGRELVVANPVMGVTAGRTAIVEGCLSVPNVWERVRRSARVRMVGQDARGDPLVVEAEGLLAIVLQHEQDHLEGRLFLDRLPWCRRWRLQTPRAAAGQR
ncbi:MAG: peptide deformylase [Candidatus Omnitrophota bacterium]|nr:peptide deformylase [Candidatus Omnitrophota bacterium]